MAITYAPTTNFGLKDSLPTNDSDKVIRGSEFTTEFTAIQTAFSLAAPNASPTFTGTVTIPTADINGGAIDGTVIGAATPAAASFTTVSATGNITVGGTVDGRDVAADGTKLDGIEAGADVTDTTNVTAAGALMDSELANIAAVKALNQGVATTDSPSFAGLTATGSVSLAGASTTADITFGDNDKAIFGAGSDLQIYSDGASGVIQQSGTGVLLLKGQDFYVQNDAGANYIRAEGSAQVDLYYGGAKKFETTATGIDVTGTVTADGLTVDGVVEVSSNFPAINLMEADTVDNNFRLFVNGGKFSLQELNDAKSVATDRVVVDTSGNVGIGVASPAQNLEIASTFPAIRLTDTDASNAVSEITGGSGILALSADGTGAVANSRIVMNVDGSEAMRIDSAGNVITGSSTANASDAVTLRQDGTAFVNNLQVANAGGSVGGTSPSLYSPASATLAISTGSTERMRLDASGNLLVGKTSFDSTTVGASLRPTGAAVLVSDGNDALLVNRKTSDGSIIDIRKDGTTVGSIGSQGGSNLYIEDADTGLRFSSASDEIAPCGSAGANRDNAITLGASNNRFKDLYLSGGVYLGGTGAANLLDEYEEGTFTPTLTSGATSVGYTNTTGHYRKIGNVVYVTLRFQLSGAVASSTHFKIGSLPFTSSATTKEGGAILNYQAGFKTDLNVSLHIAQNVTEIRFYEQSDGSSFLGTEASNINAAMHIHGFYFTD